MSDDSGERVDLYAGGACGSDSGPGGWGVWLRYGRHEKEISGGDAATTTANRMELTAPIRALENLTRSCVVRIHTGSAYVRDGVTKWLGDGKEAADNRDLWRQLDAAMAPHDVSWHWLDDHDERAGQLAVDGMRKAVADAVADDGECVHELPIGQCALCKPPPPGVRPRGYRTEAGNAYHNDRDCTWMHRGQQRAERQGKNVRDIVRVVWATVRPGELEPCEYCCTPQWLRQHGC